MVNRKGSAARVLRTARHTGRKRYTWRKGVCFGGKPSCQLVGPKQSRWRGRIPPCYFGGRRRCKAEHAQKNADRAKRESNHDTWSKDAGLRSGGIGRHIIGVGKRWEEITSCTKADRSNWSRSSSHVSAPGRSKWFRVSVGEGKKLGTEKLLSKIACVLRQCVTS